MKEEKTGLTLGKFAPLHKGHQLVIETALEEMDKVILVIYDCTETTIPLNVRSEWIRELYPQVEVIEAWDGPTETGDTPEIKKVQEDYILKILDGRKITHFYSSEFYGEHMSVALSSVNRKIDEERNKIPVSGTIIRENPFKYREFMHPLVYRDFIINVVFLGAPSTGKTSLSEELAKRHNTVWMPEYGREYWDNNQVDRRLTLEQLVEIAEGHLEREEKLLFEANKYLFTDTNAITTYMFSLYYHGEAHEKLIELAEGSSKRYDLVFVCDADIPYDDTWDRSGDANRVVFQKQIIGDLQVRKIPFFVLKGDMEERISYVNNILNLYNKYDSVYSIFDKFDK